MYGHSQPWETHFPGIGFFRDLLGTCAGGESLLARVRGRENFNYPHSWHLLDLLSEQLDIIHLHNLHGGYFDLRYLAILSHQKPVVITLHDAWPLSGHCAHSLDCTRWQIGCGQCPDLTIYPSLLRDGTAYNWQRKRQIFNNSQLYVVTPSNWLMNKVRASMLKPIESLVIPNGVDVEIFCPGDKQAARVALHLPVEAFILLYVGSVDPKDSFKDFGTLLRAIAALEATERHVILVCVNVDQPSYQVGNVTVLYRHYESQARQLALYYQAADVYVHSAHAENFPYVILEAMACGLPVVATSVGGIPEQVEDNITGFLVTPREPEELAQRIRYLAEEPAVREKMGKQAVRSIQRRFTLAMQVDAYLAWYDTVIASWSSKNVGKI